MSNGLLDLAHSHTSALLLSGGAAAAHDVVHRGRGRAQEPGDQRETDHRDGDLDGRRDHDVVLAVRGR